VNLTPGTRITALFGSGEIHHGVVVRSIDAATFVFRWYVIGHGSVGGPTWMADVSDEGVVWTRGLLLWWWPPHRKLRRAMQAAHALAPGRGVSMHKTAQQNEAMEFKKSFDTLVGDANKIIEDFEKTFSKLPGTTVSTTVRTYASSRRFRR
jgi:hypothetical protein